MRLLRLFIISVILLFTVITAISLLIPSNVRISRATNIDATPSAIWEHVDDMRDWSLWNPFFGKQVSGTVLADTAGAKATRMVVGGTTITWKEKSAYKREATMQKKGFGPIVTGWNAITHESTDSTTVQWYIDFQLRWYPWEKFSSLLFEKNYGVRMEEGLSNLKKLAETTVDQ